MPVLIVHSKQQRADLGRAALIAAFLEARDHKLLALPAFKLEPGVTAPGYVGRVDAFRNQAFESHTARRFEYVVEVSREVGAESKRPGGAAHQLFEQSTAFAQRHPAQILSAEKWNIEDEVGCRLCACIVDCLLQGVEVRDPVCAEHDDFAVKPAGSKL